MIFIVFWLIFVVSLVVALIKKSGIMIATSAIFLLLSVIIPAGIYIGNINALADLEAFYNASTTNFQIARDDTASYLSEDKVGNSTTFIDITGSIERMGVGQSVAERVAEYRNSCNTYNSSFLRYKAFSRNILFSLVYPELPGSMRLLIMNPVSNESSNNFSGTNNNPSKDSKTEPVTEPKADSETIKEAAKALQEALNRIK